MYNTVFELLKFVFHGSVQCSSYVRKNSILEKGFLKNFAKSHKNTCNGVHFPVTLEDLYNIHQLVKTVLIFKCPYFPAIGLIRRFTHIQSEYGKIQTREALNTDTFHSANEAKLQTF